MLTAEIRVPAEFFGWPTAFAVTDPRCVTAESLRSAAEALAAREVEAFRSPSGQRYYVARVAFKAAAREQIDAAYRWAWRTRVLADVERNNADPRADGFALRYWLSTTRGSVLPLP